MEVTLTFRGVRKIRYHVPKLGKVCRTAFRKVYGISKSKIEVLLNKIDLRGPSVEPDKRGQKTPRKHLPAARNQNRITLSKVTNTVQKILQLKHFDASNVV